MARRIVRIGRDRSGCSRLSAAVVADGLVFVGGMRGGRSDKTAGVATLPEKFRADALFDRRSLTDEQAISPPTDGRAREPRSRAQGRRIGRVAGAAPAHLDARQAGVPGLRAHPHGLAEGAGAEQLPRRQRSRSAASGAAGLEALAVVPGENALFPDARPRAASTTRIFRPRHSTRRRCAAGRSSASPATYRSRPTNPATR